MHVPAQILKLCIYQRLSNCIVIIIMLWLELNGPNFAGLSRAGRSCHAASSLSSVVTEFGALSAVASRVNSTYTSQLSVATGLHFSGALVDVYLFCFQALTPAAGPWTADTIGGVRALNCLWRLSAVSGSAHYAIVQVRIGKV